LAVDGILDLGRRIGIEVAEAATEIGRATHLPEQPRQAFRALGALRRHERAELLREIEQNGARFEHAYRVGSAAIHQGRNLGVRIGSDEAAAELVALADLDQPGVVLGALVTQRQQLLEHDRDLLAIRGAQRIELQRMLADRQFLLAGRAGDRPVDVGEPAPAGLVPGPDLGRDVLGCVAHASNIL
jgi:hypothetical protein